MHNDTTDREWRCRRCSRLLGKQHGDRIHIRRNDVQLVIAGRVISVCPRCHEYNETETEGTRSAA